MVVVHTLLALCKREKRHLLQNDSFLTQPYGKTPSFSIFISKLRNGRPLQFYRWSMQEEKHELFIWSIKVEIFDVLFQIKKSSYPFRNFDRRKRGTSQKQRRITMIPVVLIFIPRKLKTIVTIVVQKRQRLEERCLVCLAHRNVIYSSSHCKVIGITSQLMTRKRLLNYFIM